MKGYTMRITTVTVGIAAVLAFTLAACGGGPPDPAKVYAEAGEKMAALDSYHMAIEFQKEDQSGTGEIDLVLPDRSQAAFRSSSGWERTVMRIGNQFYAMFPPFSPHWFVYSEQAFGFSAPDVAAFAAGLLTEITDLTYVGEEVVDGLPAHHLRGTLPPEVMARFELKDAPTVAGAMDLWVGVGDSMVRQYEFVEESTSMTSRLTPSLAMGNGGWNIVSHEPVLEH